MNKIVLKPEFKDFEAGYNNSYGKVSERNDAHLFLIEAHRAGRKDYLAMFDNPPSLEELLKAQAEEKLQDNSVYTSQPLHLPNNLQPKSQAPATPAGMPGLESSSLGQPVTAGTQEAVSSPAAAAEPVTQVQGLAGRTQTPGTPGAGAAAGGKE